MNTIRCAKRLLGLAIAASLVAPSPALAQIVAPRIAATAPEASAITAAWRMQTQQSLNVLFSPTINPLLAVSPVPSLNALAAAPASQTAALVNAAIQDPQACKAALVEAGWTPEEAQRVADIGVRVKTEASANPEVAASVAKLNQAGSARAANIQELIRALRGEFESGTTPVSAPVFDVPAVEAPAQASEEPQNPDQPSRLVPSARKISQLQNLADRDPEAAFAAAGAILDDRKESRTEVVVNALRTLDKFPLERKLPWMIKALAPEINWYSRREAARMVIANAAQLRSDANLEALVAGLRSAAASPDAPVKLAAKEALRQLGVETKSPAAALPTTGPDAPAAPKVEADPWNPWGATEETNGALTADELANQPAPKMNPKTKALLVSVIGMAAAAIFALSLVFHAATPTMPPVAKTAIVQVQNATSQAAPTPVQYDPATDPVRSLAQSADKIATRVDGVEQKLDAIQKTIDNQAKSANSIWTVIVNNIPMLLIFVAAFFGIRQLSKMQGAKKGGAGFKIKKEKPTQRFKDVAGIDESLEEVQEIAEFLKNPKRFLELGGKIPKGALLIGPPGTGKTLLAKAIAGESDAGFYSVSGSDFVEMFVGVGAKRVRELFDTARKNKPAIIFIDEIDAVGKARGGTNSHDEREQTLNALLVEMDGFDSSSGVIVLAATNGYDSLDKALTRPGRFDRTINVDPPDKTGREAILALHARGTKIGPDVDLWHVAQRTTGMAGAHLANAVNEAALMAGRFWRKVITRDDFNEGVDKSIAGQKRNILIPYADKLHTTRHEVGHALLETLLGETTHRVTMLPRGKALGIAFNNNPNQFLKRQSQYEKELVSIFGGMVVEELYNGESSSGPSNDLEQANAIARAMVERFGMGGQNTGYLAGPAGLSQETLRQRDLAVMAITQQAHDTARRMILEHQAVFDEFTRQLMAHETLDAEQIDKIVFGPNGRPKPAVSAGR